jgi:hypothetical protein
MPDLSAYLDFSLQLNYKTGKMVLTDTSAYPVGVTVEGIITALQPDGITRTGDFTSPDIDTSVSPTGEIELRKNSLGAPQTGSYTVTYTVRAAGYDDTTVSNTFTLVYTRPTVVIGKLFDVYTPSLFFVDSTNYDQTGFTQAVTRAWDVQGGNVGTKTGTSDTLDLKIGGNYYDAIYEGTLAVEVDYTSTEYFYLTLKDVAYGYIETSADTPPSFTTLKSYLKAIKARFDSDTACSRIDSGREDYEYASSLLQQIRIRICDNDTVNLTEQVQDFLDVYYERLNSSYTNTDAVIPAYNNADCDCGGGGAVGGASIFPLYITQDDFTSATFYPDIRLSGNTLRIHINQIPRYLSADEFTVDATGLTILMDGFDATTGNWDLDIFKVNA